MYNLHDAETQEAEQFEHYLEDHDPRHLRVALAIEQEIEEHGGHDL